MSLEDDWYEDVNDPASVIAGLNESHTRPDIFTFWQRLPDVEPKYQYHTEWESLAVLPIKGFDYWWSKQIKDKTRNMVRKAKKAGIEVREASYDDAFVQGMTDIFNETPVRQGRQFWHYGKDFETVKRQFSRFLFREEIDWSVLWRRISRFCHVSKRWEIRRPGTNYFEDKASRQGDQ